MVRLIVKQSKTWDPGPVRFAPGQVIGVQDEGNGTSRIVTVDGAPHVVDGSADAVEAALEGRELAKANGGKKKGAGETPAE